MAFIYAISNAKYDRQTGRCNQPCNVLVVMWNDRRVSPNTLHFMLCPYVALIENPKVHSFFSRFLFACIYEFVRDYFPS